MSELTPIVEREREMVQVTRAQCYSMLVAAGVAIMALIGVTLLYAVRPAIVHDGLPQCTIDANKQPTSVVWPANRAQLLSTFRNATRPAGFLFFQGATVVGTGDGDSTFPFRQGSDFLYVSGAHALPDCFMVWQPARSVWERVANCNMVVGSRPGRHSNILLRFSGSRVDWAQLHARGVGDALAC